MGKWLMFLGAKLNDAHLKAFLRGFTYFNFCCLCVCT